MLQFVSALHEMKQVLVITTLLAGCAKEPEPPQQIPTKAPLAKAPADGRDLYERRGCVSCHSLDGTSTVGPSFKGAWGSTVKLQSGSQVTYDEAYVKESILDPTAKVRLGFSPTQPSYEGLLTDEQLTALITFIKAQT